MKILLVAVNAKYIHTNPALYSLKEYALSHADERERYGEQIELAEYTVNHLPDQVLRDIFERNPDVICISCYIWNIVYVRALVSSLCRILPEAEIWLGGPEVSFESRACLMSMPGIRGIMAGEGERTFSRLASHYIEGKPAFHEIGGIIWREGDSVTEGEPAPVMDLDRLPFLYEHGCPDNKILYYESSRGCPFRCSYCLSSVDKHLRFRDLALVKKELQYFLDRKVPQVKFVDRTFNCRREHALCIWRYIKEHDNGITNFHFEIAADLMDEEELALLKNMRPGQIQLEIGVQSTNPDTIREIRRSMDLDRVREVVDRINSFGNIHQHLDLIAGLPWENLESFKRSFNEVYSMRPEQLQLGFLKVLKGSYMYEKASDYGISYQEYPPYEVLSTKWLPYKDIIRLKSIEDMTEVYYNSGQFKHTLRYLEGYYPSPYEMYDELAVFYRREGVLFLALNRMDRYRLLFRFLEETKEADLSVGRQLLTYDLYLRENVRNRPDFAADESQYRKEIGDFFAGESKNHTWFPGLRELNYRQLLHTAHMEILDFNLQKFLEKGELCREKCRVLFDYSRRSPLDGNAAVCQILDK